MRAGVRAPIRRLAVAALAGVAVLAAIRLAGPAGTEEDGSSSEALATIRANALELATASGDATPLEVRLVATGERAAVAATSGAQVASNREVYLVTMTGTFSGHRASRIQRGVAPPRGPVLVAAFEARTLTLVHWGITERAPALAKLGEPIPLDLGAAGPARRSAGSS